VTILEDFHLVIKSFESDDRGDPSRRRVDHLATVQPLVHEEEAEARGHQPKREATVRGPADVLDRPDDDIAVGRVDYPRVELEQLLERADDEGARGDGEGRIGSEMSARQALDTQQSRHSGFTGSVDSTLKRMSSDSETVDEKLPPSASSWMFSSAVAPRVPNQGSSRKAAGRVLPSCQSIGLLVCWCTCYYQSVISDDACM
jgi:hypothetical protein